MVRITILPSIGALVGVSPVLWLAMGKINLTSVLANVLIAPLVPLLSWLLIIITLWAPLWLIRLIQMLLDLIIASASYSTQWAIWLVLDRPFAIILGLCLACYRCWWIWTQTQVVSEDEP